MKVVAQEWNWVCPTRMSRGRNVAAPVACCVSLVRPGRFLTRDVRQATRAADRRHYDTRQVTPRACREVEMSQRLSHVACRLSLVENNFSKAQPKEIMK